MKLWMTTVIDHSDPEISGCVAEWHVLDTQTFPSFPLGVLSFPSGWWPVLLTEQSVAWKKLLLNKSKNRPNEASVISSV